MQIPLSFLVKKQELLVTKTPLRTITSGHHFHMSALEQIRRSLTLAKNQYLRPFPAGHLIGFGVIAPWPWPEIQKGNQIAIAARQIYRRTLNVDVRLAHACIRGCACSVDVKAARAN